jgi:hypothetical protein
VNWYRYKALFEVSNSAHKNRKRPAGDVISGPLPDPEDLENFQKLFSGFMSFLKILEIVLGLPTTLPDPEISESPYF